MEILLKDSWSDLDNEQKVKKYEQKELGNEWAASQELLRHYPMVEEELS